MRFVCSLCEYSASTVCPGQSSGACVNSMVLGIHSITKGLRDVGTLSPRELSRTHHAPLQSSCESGLGPIICMLRVMNVHPLGRTRTRVHVRDSGRGVRVGGRESPPPNLRVEYLRELGVIGREYPTLLLGRPVRTCQDRSVPGPTPVEVRVRLCQPVRSAGRLARVRLSHVV